MAFVWTTPAVFSTAPADLAPGSSGSYPAASQAMLYPATAGFGVVTTWNDDNFDQEAQFSLIAITPPAPASSPQNVSY